MRAHPGLILFVVLIAVGVVLEVIGQNLLGTVLILVTVVGALGAARGRSRDAMHASTGRELPPSGRRRLP